mmetsp:Transcript_43445/g.138637  ORF Transcript_43445/g.138637 Transcript_43445/m.138637 type:complete len:298 (-) Transcript_43445:169-1062(-)
MMRQRVPRMSSSSFRRLSKRASSPKPLGSVPPSAEAAADTRGVRSGDACAARAASACWSLWRCIVLSSVVRGPAMATRTCRAPLWTVRLGAPRAWHHIAATAYSSTATHCSSVAPPLPPAAARLMLPVVTSSCARYIMSTRPSICQGAQCAGTDERYMIAAAAPAWRCQLPGSASAVDRRASIVGMRARRWGPYMKRWWCWSASLMGGGASWTPSFTPPAPVLGGKWCCTMRPTMPTAELRMATRAPGMTSPCGLTCPSITASAAGRRYAVSFSHEARAASSSGGMSRRGTVVILMR